MNHSENKIKMQSIEFTLKEKPKLKQDHCQKCKKCTCINKLSFRKKELVKL